MEAYQSLGVLVVDDEPFMLKILGRLLDDMGISNVTTVESGENALSILEGDSELQLILLDINMPTIDGVEFIRSLVTLGYTGSLILVSGETERALEAVEKLAKARGIAVLGYLQKPVVREALTTLIKGMEPPETQASSREQASTYDSETLRNAISNGELVCHYQPKVDVRNGDFLGAEVLVRWNHPGDGLVYPDQFIPLAEDSGLMHELTTAVLCATFKQMRLWQDAGLQVKPAINISMDNLNTLTFPDDLATLAADFGVSTQGITLEVTESQIIPNLATVLDTLSRLHLKRINLAIDDFGTGYSSLAQLSDLPFDQLKIDKRFVHDASADPTASAIFIASRNMGVELGMEVVAEGVESRADWDWLQKSGCDVAQGYFIARPMPAEALPAWLAEWRQRQQTGLLAHDSGSD